MKQLFYKDKQEPLFDTAFDAKKKEDAEEIQRRMAKWRNDFIQTFCSHDAGRRVLWFLIHETYVFREYRQHNAGAYALEGKRELGLEMMNILGHEQVLQTLSAVTAEANKEVNDD